MRKLRIWLYLAKKQRVASLMFLSWMVLMLGLRWWLDGAHLRHPLEYSIQSADAVDDNTVSDASAQELPSAVPVDPNVASVEALQAIGLSRKVAQNLVKYRSYGGKYPTLQAMEKIYGMTPDMLAEAAPYLLFPQPSAAYAEKNYDKKPDKKFELPTTPFDPHQVQAAQLEAWGVPKYAAMNWLRFVEKGGRFKQSTDVLKIYGLDPAVGHALLPFVEIPATSPPAYTLDKPIAVKEKEVPKKKAVVLDVNTASEEDWQQLSGVGPSYANRIVRFREKLGGFCTVDQIAETRGLPDSVFQQIRPSLRIEQGVVQVDINQVRHTELKGHPYINPAMAKQLELYRNQHGAFTSISDLYKMEGQWRPEIVKKVGCYFKF